MSSAKRGADLNVLVLSPTPTHPQDFGNRKRIYRVCKGFADEGARITFVHYPSEAEWRTRVPASAERAMQQCWDHYYTVGPTRDLHNDPIGRTHSIDEWWDDAIGDFLRWIFSVQRVDIFIVNYSWLSKALEYAPPGTFKILDTHDKVSGRRDMLASLRLGPEFFYTDESEEAVALGRADLVWAIKDEERAQFEQMTSTPVVTMPHLDLLSPLERPAPDPDGYLRVGVIGARNNVNRMNITEFLNKALPLFEAAFAPVKIVIAGTMCDLLEGIDSPFVELRGPVDDVEDFYRTVDCVAVPMRASTGLKIKAGEALSLGVPLLSLAHAFEGYEPSAAAHVLPDFTTLAEALIDLSFSPRAELDILAEASKTSYARTASKIGASLTETIERAYASTNSIVLTVDSRAFIPGSVFNLVMESIYEYLRAFGVLKVLIVQGNAEGIVRNARSTERLDKVFVADSVAGTGERREALSRLGVTVVNAAEYLAHTQPKILVLDALHSDLATLVLPQTVVLSRTEIIALSQGYSATWLPGKGFKGAIAAMPGVSRSMAGLAASADAVSVSLPCLRLAALGKIKAAQSLRGHRTLAVLGDPASPAVNMAIAMIYAWGMEPLVVCSLDSKTAEISTYGVSIPAIRADAYLDSLFSQSVPRPHVVLDLSNGQAGLGLCREILERLRVPLASGSEAGMHPSLAEGGRPFHAGTERELWRVVRSFALGSDEAHNEQLIRGWNEIEHGKGWAWFTRMCSELFGTEYEAAA